MAISKAQFKKIALSFPEAHEKASYGSPAIFVAKKFFTRLREQDDSIVWIVGSIDERDHMLEMDPATYFITEHYKDYPSVLVRTSRIDQAMLKKMLERRWRAIAPKKLIKEVDAAAPPAKKAGAKAKKRAKRAV
ncbi:MAG TPA: MmcQ/YjbR family DNA-binding protein [Rhizomicrobium sp.]|nr:MmcQ/YjbR family DNA-binding protein [Rhizomicrobium sp.]